MHIDIHQFGREIQGQYKNRMTRPIEHVPIRLPQGMRDQLVANHAAIHKEKLMVGVTARPRRQAHPTMQTIRPATFIQGNVTGQKTLTQYPGESCLHPTCTNLQPCASLREFEGHLRLGENQPPDHRINGLSLASFCLHELATGRGIEKEITDFDRSPCGMSNRPLEIGNTTAHRHGPAHGHLRRARLDLDLRNTGDTGEGFATKAETLHQKQILRRPDLAGGMTSKRTGQVVFRYAMTVVTYHDAIKPTGFGLNDNACGTGVKTVFHQLLDDGRGPLDNLASGDLVGNDCWQDVDPSCHRVRPGPGKLWVSRDSRWRE